MSKKQSGHNRNHGSYDDAYAELTIDPATIPGLSREAILLAKHKGKFQLFNQKVLVGSTLDPTSQMVSYRNPALLKQFISPLGNILPRRTSGIKTRRVQTLVSQQVKRARQLALLYYPGQNVIEPVSGD